MVLPGASRLRAGFRVRQEGEVRGAGGAGEEVEDLTAVLRKLVG
jgi:hypothetical protein